ncbi:sybindin-like family protein [Lasiosphaeria miniovina]|uniref:Trafficking protein particle complex subunit n=1 Tax=Lasiosphaeria miniovina TaxID=1954250 RepID=A0AA40E592_9PEZI|nr:sybindin-like family protein [Lasiosphaeria miniovina]KAK0722973.1 sybindin-like family protein [Lasiosphaeria miniovina]
MVIYSFYIFDRHTECIYSKLWLPPSAAAAAAPATPATANIVTGDGAGSVTLAPRGGPHNTDRRSVKVKASDDAKLIFGTVFSLRNMVRKLGGDDDAFISYRTGQYKLHYYETASSLRFVMLTDTTTLSMRSVLHQIYINLWVEYVVKNPLAPVEHKGGDGVKNELFELGLDQFVRGLM